MIKISTMQDYIAKFLKDSSPLGRVLLIPQEKTSALVFKAVANKLDG